MTIEHCPHCSSRRLVSRIVERRPGYWVWVVVECLDCGAVMS